jgi:Calcineurin-like phosphoesterase
MAANRRTWARCWLLAGGFGLALAAWGLAQTSQASDTSRSIQAAADTPTTRTAQPASATTTAAPEPPPPAGTSEAPPAAPSQPAAAGQGGQGGSQMPALPPLRGTPALGTPADPTHFTFVVAGDNRPATATPTPTATFGQILDEVTQLKPPFMVLMGDIIYGKDDQDPQLIEQEYQAFMKLVDGAGVPIFNAPGNHEMAAKGNRPSQKMEDWYGQYTGSVPYGAFTWGNSRFIALNTDDLPGTGDCAGGGAAAAPAAKGKAKFDGDLGSTQLQLLAGELASDTAFTNVFVFMHRPIYAEKSSSRLIKGCRDELKKLFDKYPNIRLVAASHEHLFYQPAKSAKSGSTAPVYVVSGGAGAPLAKGGYYNYLVVTVAGDQVTFKVVKPGAPPAAR